MSVSGVTVTNTAGVECLKYVKGTRFEMSGVLKTWCAEYGVDAVLDGARVHRDFPTKPYDDATWNAVHQFVLVLLQSDALRGYTVVRNPNL